MICEGVPPPVGVRWQRVHHWARDGMALLLLWVCGWPPLRLRLGSGVLCCLLGRPACLLFALLLLSYFLVGLRLPWVCVGIIYWSVVSPCVFGGSPRHPAFGVLTLCRLLPCLLSPAVAWLVEGLLCLLWTRVARHGVHRDSGLVVHWLLQLLRGGAVYCHPRCLVLVEDGLLHRWARGVCLLFPACFWMYACAGCSRHVCCCRWLWLGAAWLLWGSACLGGCHDRRGLVVGGLSLSLSLSLSLFRQGCRRGLPLARALQ